MHIKLLIRLTSGACSVKLSVAVIDSMS